MKADYGQWGCMDSKLKAVLWWLEETTGLEFTITSPYRIGDDGVHGTLPLRAVDLRCPVPDIGEVIARYINTFFTYDPERPTKHVAIFHGPVNHLHIQVHPNTVGSNIQ